jgi:hypothetical protein
LYERGPLCTTREDNLPASHPLVVHMYSAGSGRLVVFDKSALVRPKQFEQDAYLSVPPRAVVGNQPSHRRTTYIIFESVSPLCHTLSHASYITVTSKPFLPFKFCPNLPVLRSKVQPW